MVTKMVINQAKYGLLLLSPLLLLLIAHSLVYKVGLTRQ